MTSKNIPSAPASSATFLSQTASLVQEAARRWSGDGAAQMSAAISYYAMFSLAPLIILVIAFAGLVFGKEAAQGRIDDQISWIVGTEGARAIQSLIKAAWKPTQGWTASLISIVTLLFGAMGVLLELKKALNKIWRTPATSGFQSVIRDRLRSLGLIVSVGFLMLVSLLISVVIAAISKWFGHILPVPEWVLQTTNLGMSWLVMTGLFALIYKWLPETRVAWRDVWVGAGVTAILFDSGKLAIGLYIGKSGVSSTYGAAGSLVLILVWVYYSAMILCFGAEFTSVYAERYGSRRTPARPL